ncbi:MAG: DUF1800 family protein [Chloroflexota bacterium]
MNRRQFLTFNHAAKPVADVKGAPLLRPLSAKRNSNLSPRELAARFLMQATLGPTLAEIDAANARGFAGWIDDQMALPATKTLTYMWEVVDKVYFVENQPLLHVHPFRWAWWQAVMRNPDTLRQRVAMALSEIMVISTRTDLLVDTAIGVASFYDVLLRHSFGNFRDLLFDVAMHPAMGYYLSHAGNRKADPSVNRFPDENFAREIMQLFSIGLFELNQDGTRKKDALGNDIPTYDNNDIQEFAKIFTGLTYTLSAIWEEEGLDPSNGDDFAMTYLFWDNASNPMVMYEQYHEPGPKQLLNGVVVPAGQPGMQDVNDAIDNLFDHPNVGPFIGRLLIQRLVKSNPSSAYISRVAGAFNDNGSGVRGDMGAVVRAILLDDEARNPAFINDPTHGMLREPFVRYVQICRATELYNEQGEDLFYNMVEPELEFELGQYPFASPSVFNFFSPNYRPLGPLNTADLTAPEFQIATSVAVNKLFNLFEHMILYDELMVMPEGMDEEEEQIVDGFEQRMPNISRVSMNLTPYDALEGNVPALVDSLNLLFANGSLSDATQSIIQTAITALYTETEDWGDAVRAALVMVVTCPEAAIFK